MSTVKTTNITHASNSGTSNLVLADNGNVTVAGAIAATSGLGKLVNIATTSVVGEVSAETAQGATATTPLISLNYAAASASNKILILASLSIAMSSTAKCGVSLYINGSAEDAYRRSTHGNRQRVSAWTRPGSSDRLNSCLLYTSPSPRDRG